MSFATLLRAKRSVASARVDVAAADQVHHQAGLLGRGADVLRRCVGLNWHYAPAFAAGATEAALSLFVVWPLNARVGANSPSLWPTMFSVM